MKKIVFGIVAIYAKIPIWIRGRDSLRIVTIVHTQAVFLGNISLLFVTSEKFIEKDEQYESNV